MNVSKPIGIVGLGLMGSALAQRLLDAGYAVLGFDIDREQRAALENIGGTFAGSLPDIAQCCTSIFVAVFNTEQVETVVEHDLLPAVGPNSGKIILCTSTCDPDRIAELAARVEPEGLHLLETPISGTSEQVRQGRGVVLIGGDAGKIEEATNILRAIFPSCFHMGPVGNAGRAKLAINLILGLNRLALAEGLVFAERVGLEPRRFLEVARQAASYSQVMDTKGPKMIRSDFSAGRQGAPDAEGRPAHAGASPQAGQHLPLATLNAEVLEACVRNGEGDQDNSVVISEIRRRTEPGNP